MPCASRQIARALGGSPVHIALDKKTLYHAAATLASGQVLALVEAATQLLISLGMKCNEAARSPEEIAQGYQGRSRLAARVLAQDSAGTTAELERSSAAIKTKLKVRVGNR